MDFAYVPLLELFHETHNILSRLVVQSLEFYRYTNTSALGYYER